MTYLLAVAFKIERPSNAALGIAHWICSSFSYRMNLTGLSRSKS